MSTTLAKEFETTSQLPPSTPQQRMTPPTVLLPATFAILPPQGAAISAALAAHATPAVTMTMSMPLLSHSLASTAAPQGMAPTPEVAATQAFIGGGASPASNPSLHFGSPSLYPAFDLSSVQTTASTPAAAHYGSAFHSDNGGSPVSESASTGVPGAVPARTAATTTSTAVNAMHGATQQAGAGQRTACQRAKATSERLSIVLPSPCAPPPPSPPQQPATRATTADSPAEAGSRPSTTDVEEDELMMPLTPASSSACPTRRSVSAFDSSGALTTFERNGPRQSRAHSCSSRSGSIFFQSHQLPQSPQQQQQLQQRPASAAAASALRLTSPTTFVNTGHGDGLWQHQQQQQQQQQRHSSLPAPPVATHAGAAVAPGTPVSVLSASSTPPAMGSGHASAAAPPPFAFYPGWGVDGVCAFCPITSFVETKTTASTANSREELSVGRVSTSSSSQRHQPQQQQQQQQQLPSTSSRRGGTQRTTSSVESRRAGSTGTASRRSYNTRTHVSLHEGPVVITTTAAPAAATGISASTTPVSPSVGRQTPSSPLFIAPALYVHADPTRTFGNHNGRTGEGGGDLSSFLNATSRPPTPPSGGRSAAVTATCCSNATIAATTAAAPGGCGVSPQARHPSGVHIHPSAPNSSNLNCGSLGAMDPLSDFATQALHSSHLTPQQQPQQLLKDGGNPQLPHPYPSFGAATAGTTTMHTATNMNLSTSAFPGNLTFVPIEVQSTSTVLSPFFGSMGNQTTAITTATSSPANTAHGTHPPSRASSMQERGGAEGQANASNNTNNNNNNSHVSSNGANGGGFYYHPQGMPTFGAPQGSSPQLPVMPRLEHPTPCLEESASISGGFPPSAATPTRAYSTWPPYAAPGVVTAILAAPEVSWSSSFSAGQDNAAVSAAATIAGSASGLSTNTTTPTTATTAGTAVSYNHSHHNNNNNTSASSRSSSASGLGGVVGHAISLRDGAASATNSQGTHSPGTTPSLPRTTSPAPWLLRACNSLNNGSSVNGFSGHAGGASGLGVDGVHSSSGGGGSGGHTDENGLSRSTFSHAVAPNFHAYSAAAALPSFSSSVQFQLSCTPVPLDDTESECVICFEGHPTQAEQEALLTRDSNNNNNNNSTSHEGRSASETVPGDFGGGVKPGSQLLMMPCKHCCHQNCLQRWLIQSTCCPICRRDLTQDATPST